MVTTVAGPASWVCPHCNFAQIVSRAKISGAETHINIAGLAEGTLVLKHQASGCSNPECRKLTLSCYLYPASAVRTQAGTEYYYSGAGVALAGMRFLPKGSSKPQPEFVPRALVSDYEEACAIRDLSPKASATLVRRCLQGMIRDFCGITRGTLASEIKALREAVDNDDGPKGVDSDTVDAIDHVRSIGNIGAHMEKDINVIVDVDADEAQMLIELVEMLFVEWYATRDRRSKSLQAIRTLSSQKENDRKQLPAPAADFENEQAVS